RSLLPPRVVVAANQGRRVGIPLDPLSGEMRRRPAPTPERKAPPALRPLRLPGAELSGSFLFPFRMPAQALSHKTAPCGGSPLSYVEESRRGRLPLIEGEATILDEAELLVQWIAQRRRAQHSHTEP